MTTQARELAKIVNNAGDLFFVDDVALASDGAVLNFGADNDVTLTHVADTGLLINSTRQLQFGDSGTYIHQSADGVLDLVSDTEIELNATTLDINANVDISGTLTVAGVLDFGDAAISNVGEIQLDSIAGDGDTNTSITFSGSDVITVATGGTTAFTVDASQRVLLGTTNTYNAEADNLIIFDSGNAGLTIATGSTSGNNTIHFADGTGGDAQYRGVIEYEHNDDSMRFKVNGEQEAVRIDSSGNVGIGTTSPSGNLHVASDGNGLVLSRSGYDTYTLQHSAGVGMSIFNVTDSRNEMKFEGDGQIVIGSTSDSFDNNSKIVLRPDSDSYIINDGQCLSLNRTSSHGVITGFYYNGSLVGSISSNTNSLPSDRNFKRDISDLDLGLNLITKLKPSQYNYKIDSDDCPKMYGLIAQDLEESLTEVGVEKNSSWLLQHEPNSDKKQSDYSLDYLKLTPVLIKAIQELEARVKQLEG